MGPVAIRKFEHEFGSSPFDPFPKIAFYKSFVNGKWLPNG